jgi:hypothetical protein
MSDDLQKDKSPLTTLAVKRRLSLAHRDELASSGWTRKAIEESGAYTTADPILIARLLNWTGGKRGTGDRCLFIPAAAAMGPCLVYPYHDLDGRPTGYHRLKPTHPRVVDFKPVKYEAPLGEPWQLYVPVGVGPLLRDPAVDLVITEGEKKAVAGWLAGVPTVGVAGVWAWQKPFADKKLARQLGLPRELIPDLWGMPTGAGRRPRRLVIAFDSDRATNPQVLYAEQEFKKALRRTGAAPRVLKIPPGPRGQKAGLDDFIVQSKACKNGVSALTQMLGTLGFR